MEVIYKKPLVVRIEEEKTKAQREGKTIERIVLDEKEAQEAYRCLIAHTMRPSFLKPSLQDFRRSLLQGQVVISGVTMGLNLGCSL